MGGVLVDGLPLHARDHLPDGPDPIDFPDAPPASAVPIEWIYYTSTTDWGSGGLTTLTFTTTGGDYDSGTPTFDLSGGNPQIKRHGHYQLLVAAFNFNTPGAGVESIIRMDLAKVSGPTPTSWRSWATGSAPLVQHSIGIWSTGALAMWPAQTDFLHFGTSASFATPFTMKVDAWRLDNGTITADTGVTVRLAIQRLGDPYT